MSPKYLNLLEAVQGFMQKKQMVQAGETVCCALSGGADSVCLLRCLLALAAPMQFQVIAIHINHQLRGEESERDAAFCEQLCWTLGVPLQVVRCDVTTYAHQHRCSIETAARECRYQAFAAVRADHIATAHTASDNLETMLHRVIRGSGLRGLAGIPPVRERYIRPLLAVTRTEVEAFLETLAQPFVTDSTNNSDDYTRNRIRHQLIPQMQQLNPSLERTSVGMFSALQMEQDYLQQQANAAFQTCRTADSAWNGLATLHPALQMRCLMLALEEHGISYDAARLQALQSILQNGGKYNLSGNIYAICKRDVFSIVSLPDPPEAVLPQVLQWGKNQLFSGFVVEARLLSMEEMRKTLIVHKKLSKWLLDYDKIKGVIYLQERKYGDVVQFAGHRSASSVKRMIQKQVPPERRKTLHFLADAEGTVFGECLGIAARVQPDETTQRFLMITIQAEGCAD